MCSGPRIPTIFSQEENIFCCCKNIEPCRCLWLGSRFLWLEMTVQLREHSVNKTGLSVIQGSLCISYLTAPEPVCSEKRRKKEHFLVPVASPKVSPSTCTLENILEKWVIVQQNPVPDSSSRECSAPKIWPAPIVSIKKKCHPF